MEQTQIATDPAAVPSDRRATDSYYDIHLFICTNRRSNSKSCGGNGAERILRHAKRRVQALEDSVNLSIRVSSSGCMGRCELGPLLVIYPEGIWYRCSSPQDLDEIINQHVIGGGRVQRLMASF